jgi:hypothetical protein
MLKKKVLEEGTVTRKPKKASQTDLSARGKKGVAFKEGRTFLNFEPEVMPSVRSMLHFHLFGTHVREEGSYELCTCSKK